MHGQFLMKVMDGKHIGNAVLGQYNQYRRLFMACYRNLVTNTKFQLCAGLNMVSLPPYSNSITAASEMMLNIPNCTGIYRWKRMVDCLNPRDLTHF